MGEITGHNKVINSVDIKQSRPYRLATGSDDNCAAFFEGPPFKFKFTIGVSGLLRRVVLWELCGLCVKPAEPGPVRCWWQKVTRAQRSCQVGWVMGSSTWGWAGSGFTLGPCAYWSGGTSLTRRVSRPGGTLLGESRPKAACPLVVPV